MSKPCKMNSRCPRALTTHPESWCPLGVMRLKAIRNAGRELSEEEESKLPGCPWATNHQLANYCFFKYMSDYGEGESASDSEVAALLYVSVDTVKKTEKTAINKIRDQESFKEIKSHLDSGESILDEKTSNEDDGVYV